jgi:hypothetical protein
MPVIEKKIKQSLERLKQLVKRIYHRNKETEWALQPVPIKRN